MQPTSEMSRNFWRHGITVHMRVFELDTYRAIQWWYPDNTGVIYVPKDGKIEPEFDGKKVFSRIAIDGPTVELPEIPDAVDIAKFHRDVEALAKATNKVPGDILKSHQVITDMLELTGSTSGNEIEKKLAFHRAKKKLKAVSAFKSKT